jgi:hypothetical protein
MEALMTPMIVLSIGIAAWIVVPSLFVVLYSPRLPADPTEAIFPRFIDPTESDAGARRRAA